MHKRQPIWNNSNYIYLYIIYPIEIVLFCSKILFVLSILFVILYFCFYIIKIVYNIYYIITFPSKLSFSFRYFDANIADIKTLSAPNGVTNEAGANA